MTFFELLQKAGWTQPVPFTYRKANWLIVCDTSAWLEVGTDATPRVFDVPFPEAGREQWTLNLIQHLCRTDDELQKLRK